MKKTKLKNGDIQQNKRKVPRTACQECLQHRRRNRQCSNDSGINFVVDVSSSGTNLNHKIQYEMAKLERQIRNQKINIKGVCSAQDHPEKVENDRKCVKNGIRIDSSTNAKGRMKGDTIKIPSTPKKTSLKKLKSASRSRHLIRDLKFAESLNFGKEIGLHLSISNMKRILNPPFATTNENLKSDTKKGNLKFEDMNLFREKIIQNSNKEKGNLLQESKKVYKPAERKRFYSFLRKENCFISNCTSGTDLKKKSVQSLNHSGTVKTEIANVSEEKDKGIKKVESLEEIDEKLNEISVFPTDLIEKSILAVENVLRTVNSITKDFSGRELKDEILKSLEHTPLIDQSTLSLNCPNSFPNLNKSDKPALTLDNEAEKMEPVLKSPKKPFQISEELSYKKRFLGLKFSKDNLDPLNRALNSLRRKDKTVYLTSQHSNLSSSCTCLNVTLNQKFHRQNVSFEDFSSKTSNLKVSTSTESVLGRVKKSNDYQHGNIYSPHNQISNMKIFPEYNLQKCLLLLRKTFKDFEKMRYVNVVKKNTLEGMTQQENDIFHIKVQKTDAVNKNFDRVNCDEDYKIYFKNENFKNQSVSSMESWARSDVDKRDFKLLESGTFESEDSFSSVINN